MDRMMSRTRNRTLNRKLIADDYRIRMMEANRIEGLLPVSLTEEGDGTVVAYDLSSRDSLGHVLESGKLGYEGIRNLITGLETAVRSVSSYMIPPSDIVLHAGYIFVDPEDLTPQFICMPGYGGDFYAGIAELMKELLGGVDHEDMQAAATVYAMYRESLKPNYVLGDITNALERSSLPVPAEVPEPAMETDLDNVPDDIPIPADRKTELPERRSAGIVASLTALLTDRSRG